MADTLPPGASIWIPDSGGRAWTSATVLSATEAAVLCLDEHGNQRSCKPSECFLHNTEAPNVEVGGLWPLHCSYPYQLPSSCLQPPG